MQYNDGNKARLREEERESLRVLSSVGDNYIRKRDRERRAICIYLAVQNNAALRLGAERGAESCQDLGKRKVLRKCKYSTLKYFRTQL